MAHPDHSWLTGVAGIGVSCPGRLDEVRHKDRMCVSSPFVIGLTEPERREQSRRARSTRTPHRDPIRARIVLAAADGEANAVIARQVGVGVDTVRKWRKRFAADRLVGLGDAARPGRHAAADMEAAGGRGPAGEGPHWAA